MVNISSSPMSILWVLMLVAAANSALGYIITMPGCNETCQNSDLLIPFPFGIGRNCYHNYSEHYEVVCKPSNSSPGAFNPFLKKLNIRVFNISFRFDVNDNYNFNENDNSKYNIEVASDRQELCPGRKSKYPNDLRGSPFSYLVSGNQIVVEGCPAHVNIKDDTGEVMSGCSAFCKDDADTIWVDDACGGCTNGLGGCLTELAPYGYLEYYEIEMSNMSNVLVRHNNSNTCLNVTLMKTYSSYLSISGHSAIWMWNTPPIFEVSSRESCNHHNINSGAGFLCFCKHGYKGNPYLPYGCHKLAAQRKSVILGLGISLGSITFLICCYGLFHVIRRWIRIKRKAKFFKRNGGLLLQQQVTTKDGRVAKSKVFGVDELDKATDSFNGNRILGRGGQGTVYKGMLLDGSVVAIKKSLKVDESQIEQFINEVVILSQINHRNVVKLLGCCLETEVPLLVYEFIQNGTLGQHIHNRDEDFHITWKMRLQIAAESAGAVAYLHSASTTPIYHRDIKSANILLDGKYRAKVADFGTSRTVLIDQTHLTTLVQGTLGYLDPEYFQTNQYTEKSDVYSFGVVLVELLTGQKPLSSTQSGGWKSLTNDFLLHMETSRLFDIIDSQILSEAKEEELLAMASLARRCLNLNGRQRPTMKEVSSLLEGIRSSTLPPSAVYHSEFNEYEEIIELGETPEGHVVTNTFCSENIVKGDSSSIEVKPLMHCTI